MSKFVEIFSKRRKDKDDYRIFIVYCTILKEEMKGHLLKSYIMFRDL